MLFLAVLLAVQASPLEALADYTGHCWVAEIAEGTTDRHCFSSVDGGAHIRDTHVVSQRGRAVYSGETLYSAEAGRVVFTYWNSLGGVGHGVATVADGELSFAMKMRATPDADPQDSRSTWRRTAGGYETASEGLTRRFRRDD